MYCGIYRLLNLVSTGHATEIWEAIHDASRDRYAIKKLRQERVDREQTAYLRHDYAVGHNLDHPRIITVHDFGIYKEVPYLVMELYRVPNMKQLILQGVERVQHLATKIVDQAAESLVYLAEKDWVHRDVKPDNYLVSPEGDVKMIDFALAQKQKTGLAKIFAGKARTLQGTISYMSPEQIRGQPLDAQSDVYSFGCTVYQLLTGKLPFTGMNTSEVFSKHLHAAIPSPEVYNRNLTPECSDLLRRLLSKKLEDRPEMAQFRREWNAIQIFKTPPKPPREGDEEMEEDEKLA